MGLMVYGGPCGAGHTSRGFTGTTQEHTDLAARCADAYLPFGVGSRMCVGYNFALREAKISLVRMFQQFTFTLEPDQVPLLLSHGTTLSPKLGVFVKVALRSAAELSKPERMEASSD